VRVGCRPIYRERQCPHTFRQIQSYRLHIHEQEKFVVRVIILSVWQAQFLLQAVNFLTSRFSRPSSTKQTDFESRAVRVRGAEFPYVQFRFSLCSRVRHRHNYLSAFHRYGRQRRQRLICLCLC